MKKNTVPKVLIIAGSDSGGGAGIQADIKSVSANGAYASTAITSITAQNTIDVQAIHDLPVEIIEKQIESVMDDIGADVIKTGMLSSAEIIEVVSAAIDKYKTKLVLDPVMFSKSGVRLLKDNAMEALKEKLVPKAYLLTPNIPEAEAITGLKIDSVKDMERAGKKILADYHCNAVLVKGGHLKGRKLFDILVMNNDKIFKIRSRRIDTINTHGTGCSYASAIAAHIADGNSLPVAVKKAHRYLFKAIRKAQPIGSGKGPINHFWNLG